VADDDAADHQASWVAQRRRAAEHHAAAARRQADAESAKAQRLLDRFVIDAVVAGLAPEPLRARGLGGSKRTFRTDRRGWYLRRDQSIAVDEHGHYLVLVVHVPWSAAFTGAAVVASAPPLVVGRGGKDGESIDLAVLLARRLAAGNVSSR
jgi:hypothetical protein